MVCGEPYLRCIALAHQETALPSKAVRLGEPLTPGVRLDAPLFHCLARWEKPVFWVYVLENPEGRFYVGHTDDLPRRLAEHNAPEKIGTKYTHKNGPWTLVWSEEHQTRASAIDREKSIKRMKSAAWIRRELLRR